MKFEEIVRINVKDKTEKKGNLTYLSWAWAWAEFKKIYPDATYEVKMFDGLPYVHDSDTGYMVFTSVKADGLVYDMWLPVMDARNKTLMNATMFDINKTIMRCLAKNLAMFGLGLYIYAGEDLPEETAQKAAIETENNNAETHKKTAQSVKDALTEAMETRVTIHDKEYSFRELPQKTLEWYAEKSKNTDLRKKAALILRSRFSNELNEGTEETPFGTNAEG